MIVCVFFIVLSLRLSVRVCSDDEDYEDEDDNDDGDDESSNHSSKSDSNTGITVIITERKQRHQLTSDSN